MEHMKVKSSISLEKYMIWYATSEKVGIPEQTTPELFCQKSNDEFAYNFLACIQRKCYNVFKANFHSRHGQ